MNENEYLLDKCLLIMLNKKWLFGIINSAFVKNIQKNMIGYKYLD